LDIRSLLSSVPLRWTKTQKVLPSNEGNADSAKRNLRETLKKKSEKEPAKYCLAHLSGKANPYEEGKVKVYQGLTESL